MTGLRRTVCAAAAAIAIFAAAALVAGFFLAADPPLITEEEADLLRTCAIWALVISAAVGLFATTKEERRQLLRWLLD